MTRTRTQWRETRLPQVEATAYAEIRRFERRFGAIKTPCIPVDQFLEDLWGLRYVHCEPGIFGFPEGVQGGLRTDLKKVIISEAVTHQGQQNMVKLHEGAHWVLHTSTRGGASWEQTDGGETGTPSFFCRGDVCYRDGTLEKPWMYREAEFFAACMLLPREPFALRAEGRIHQAWREQWQGHPFPGAAWFRLVGKPAIPSIVSRAVDSLYEQHEGEVSKTVIRIRLAEVGWAPAYSQQRPARDGLTPIGDVFQDLLRQLAEAYSDDTILGIAAAGNATREGVLA